MALNAFEAALKMKREAAAAAKARTLCTTCGRPADDGYVNVAARERCVDPIHLHPRGIALTRAASTATLAASFQHTDELLEQAGLDADQREQLTTARGWIMTVLEERGQLAAIGVTDDYEPISDETLDRLERAGVQPARIEAMRATRDETEARYTITGASGIEVYADDAGGAKLAAETLVETDGETSAEIRDSKHRWVGTGRRDQAGRYILITTQGREF